MGPQYTSCVAAKDFWRLPSWAITVLAGAGIVSFLAIIANPAMLTALGIVGSALILQALRLTVDWMLNYKLICLHRSKPECDCGDSGSQVCALGELGDIEDVGEDKNPIEDVDNDYGLNLILSPHDHFEFAKHNEHSFDFVNNYTSDLVTQPAKDNLKLAQAGPQGDLISAQPDMPGFTGIWRTFVYHLSSREYFAWNQLFGHNSGSAGPSGIKSAWAGYLVKNAAMQPVVYSAPVLHCEFEGTRIRDVLEAIEVFSFGGKWCKKNFFFRLICTVLQTVFAPLALANAIRAWLAASGGSQGSALADPAAGEVKPRDFLIVKGRWAYDGGHAGYNEIHAVRVVQKVAYVPQSAVEFARFQKAWCERLGEVPHIEAIIVGSGAPSGLTPKQREILDNQQKPENGWVLHPEIDGCQPTGHPEPPDIR